MKGKARHAHSPDGWPTTVWSGLLGKTNIFLQVAVAVKYIRPAALILHPVTLMIQSTQYKY